VYLRFGKRLFDFISALLGLILLAAPMSLIALAILVTSGVPIIFTQERVGKDGKLFKVQKFRTMVVRSSPDSSITTAGDARITPIGQFLRRWKLDELPQLWNVLVGEMSLVGPRPDVPGYADRLRGHERQILLLRPGITGPATLAYRHEEDMLAKADNPAQFNDEVIYPDKIRLNLEYLEKCSFSQDLAYILLTLLPSSS
jgi:lipopolysaccharide/colanic/teichoic acid biosynthesis glycosyltransferase